VLDFNNSRFGRGVADWEVENMKHDVTPYRMLSDVGVLPTKIFKRYNIKF
jgi:hypothetical protein